jgi:hypothetical protein
MKNSPQRLSGGFAREKAEKVHNGYQTEDQ